MFQGHNTALRVDERSRSLPVCPRSQPAARVAAFTRPGARPLAPEAESRPGPQAENRHSGEGAGGGRRRGQGGFHGSPQHEGVVAGSAAGVSGQTLGTGFPGSPVLPPAPATAATAAAAAAGPCPLLLRHAAAPGAPAVHAVPDSAVGVPAARRAHQAASPPPPLYPLTPPLPVPTAPSPHPHPQQQPPVLTRPKFSAKPLHLRSNPVRVPLGPAAPYVPAGDGGGLAGDEPERRLGSPGLSRLGACAELWRFSGPLTGRLVHPSGAGQEGGRVPGVQGFEQPLERVGARHASAGVIARAGLATVFRHVEDSGHRGRAPDTVTLLFRCSSVLWP